MITDGYPVSHWQPPTQQELFGRPAVEVNMFDFRGAGPVSIANAPEAQDNAGAWLALIGVALPLIPWRKWFGGRN